MATKIEQYMEIKKQMKVLEASAKALEDDVKSELTEKFSKDGFSLQKKTRVTYSVRKDVDLESIKKEYPKVIKESVNGKLLYQIAESPEKYIEEKTSEYLEVREVKQKAEDLDF